MLSCVVGALRHWGAGTAHDVQSYMAKLQTSAVEYKATTSFQWLQIDTLCCGCQALLLLLLSSLLLLLLLLLAGLQGRRTWQHTLTTADV
jgi:hypothetical protein